MKEEKGLQFGRSAKLCAGFMSLVLIGAAALSGTAYAASGASKPDLEGYSGPDAQYIINPLPDPVMKPGYKFKVGYLDAFAALSVIRAAEKGCEKKTKALGGEFIAYDSGLDIQKQISQMELLISQKVNVIVANTITDASLTHEIAAAKKAGIPVILINAPSTSEKPLDPNATASVSMALDQFDYATLKYVSKKYPNGKVAILGFGPPSENLMYQVERARYWAKDMGLDIVGQVDAADPSPNAATVATQAIMGKYPDVQVILCYNDYSTMAAATALKAAGKTGVVVGTYHGGADIVVPGLKNGSVLVAYDDPWEKVGSTAAVAAYDVLTKQSLPEKRILLIGVPATKENVDSLTFVK